MKIKRTTSPGAAVALLLGVFLALPLYGQGKRVTISAHDEPLSEVLTRVEQASGVSFYYNSSEIDPSRPVSGEFSNLTPEQIVSRLLPDAVVRAEGSRIIIKVSRQKKEAPAVSPDRKAVIRGVIRDSEGNPLPGAYAVLVQNGRSEGAMAGADGSFSIVLLKEPAPGSKITFSLMGYLDRTEEVGLRRDFSISLEEDMQVLAETVVVGYGIEKKANLTGSVSSVSDENLVKRPVMRATTALQGLAAGVSVVQTSGKPGHDGASIRIHGVGTLNDSDPLVLVDGVSGSLDAVNPNDIESISILKDAASSAIYGSRAANGVILVTTKSGSSEKLTTVYSAYAGFQSPVAMPEFSSNYEYMTAMNQAYSNVGMSPMYSESYLSDWLRYRFVDPDNYPDVDWQKMLMDGSGFTQNHHVSVRGGNKNINTFASINYQSQEGIFSGYDTDRFAARANITAKVNRYLDFSLLLDGRRSNTNRPTYGDSFILGYINRIPGLYPLILTDGRYGTGYNNRNPLALSREGGRTSSTTDAFRGTVSASFHPVDEFSIDLKFTPGISNTYGKIAKIKVDFYNPGQEAPAASAPAVSSLSQTDSKTTQTTLQVLANYHKTFAGKHNFKALAGYEQFYYQTQSTGLSREGFTLPEYQVMNAGSAAKMENEGTASAWALISFFGRLNYSYKERYLAELNFRADGSSRFAPGHKWGFFPSLSLGWRISEEGFFKGKTPFSNLKLRASWGRLGNQSIGTYPAYATITLDSVYSFNSVPADGGYQKAFANSVISWETTENFNAGLDFALLGNRLAGAFDWYYKNTYDILLKLPVQDISGLTEPYQNAGVVRNVGWDLELSYKDGIGDVSYQVSFNLSDVLNKVIDLRGAGPIRSGYTIIDEGYPIKSLYGYKADGLYRTDDELFSGADQTYFGSYAKGDIRYVNVTDADGTTNVINAYDRTVIGNQIPRFLYGLNLSASWKGFDASMMFQGIGKRDIILTGDCVWALYNGGKMQTWMMDSWTPDNPDASYPRLIAASTHNNFQYSSFWVYNAAFFRLKSVQLGYTVPSVLTKKAGMENLRLYVTGDNILTLSSLPKGWDPEMGSGDADIYPIVKTFLFGLTVSF